MINQRIFKTFVQMSELRFTFTTVLYKKYNYITAQYEKTNRI